MAEPIKTEIVETSSNTPVVSDGNSVFVLLNKALDRLDGNNAEAVVNVLGKLVELQERVQAQQAKIQFAQALADFQAECPPIPKTSTATIVGKTSGVKFSYVYAELDEIARTIQAHIKKAGLSYSWDSKFEGTQLNCTCTLRHIAGHSETAMFSAPVDGQGAMSDTQKCAAALTYAKRQSLIQVLGLTTCDPDTDGNPSETVNEDQIATLTALITEVGADKLRFLAVYGIKNLSDLPAQMYRPAVNMLETKRRKS